jgi:hypothetical protein
LIEQEERSREDIVKVEEMNVCFPADRDIWYRETCGINVFEQASEMVPHTRGKVEYY